MTHDGRPAIPPPLSEPSRAGGGGGSGGCGGGGCGGGGSVFGECATSDAQVSAREVAAACDEHVGDDPLECDLLEGVGALPRHDISAVEDCVADRLGAVLPRLLQQQPPYCNHDMRWQSYRLCSRLLQTKAPPLFSFASWTRMSGFPNRTASSYSMAHALEAK